MHSTERTVTRGFYGCRFWNKYLVFINQKVYNKNTGGKLWQHRI